MKKDPDAIFLAVLACFALSGFAALLYQTAWMRQFSTVFGTSELAVGTVLASYMAGLALGAAVAARFVARLQRPVLVYALLELGIAISALWVPAGLALTRKLQILMFGGQPQPPDAGGVSQAVFFLVATFGLIVIPTGFMGATLPMLARHAVQNRQQIARRIGWLYATNTAGAVLGTLAAAFLLLPWLGLGGTIAFGVAANLLVFLLAWGISRRSPGSRVEPDESNAAPAAGVYRWVLPMVLVSGIASFTYEVLWTRLLAHTLGTSIYAFATMLASFLIGITLGSALAA
ncbi:MAG: fused MFS/spermidine synthase, partial [Planctomycetota bacterium]